MTEKKKIIGLNCGRTNGNSSVLLKEAAMGAEELGVQTEIINAMSLKVLPCRGCWGCRKTGKCIQKDDVEWILQKTFVEDNPLIVSVPVYHLRANGIFMCISEKVNHLFRGPDGTPSRLKRRKVGAILSIGGSQLDWTSLSLATINIFIQHGHVLVDQLQVAGVTAIGTVQRMEKELARARQLGRNVAKAMQIPLEKVKYMGEDTAVSCPVCHCNLLQVPQDFPNVYCPVCWVHGSVYLEGGKMKVRWNEEDAKYPRFTLEAQLRHWSEGNETKKRYMKEHNITEDYTEEIATKLDKKYTSYGTVIKP
jgi:multimeric flavodoxin WrbA/uncharacterized Zn finger protein (UPF0148 family)